MFKHFQNCFVSLFALKPWMNLWVYMYRYNGSTRNVEQ